MKRILFLFFVLFSVPLFGQTYTVTSTLPFTSLQNSVLSLGVYPSHFRVQTYDPSVDSALAKVFLELSLQGDYYYLLPENHDALRSYGTSKGYTNISNNYFKNLCFYAGGKLYGFCFGINGGSLCATGYKTFTYSANMSYSVTQQIPVFNSSNVLTSHVIGVVTPLYVIDTSGVVKLKYLYNSSAMCFYNVDYSVSGKGGVLSSVALVGLLRYEKDGQLIGVLDVNGVWCPVVSGYSANPFKQYVSPTGEKGWVSPDGRIYHKDGTLWYDESKLLFLSDGVIMNPGVFGAGIDVVFAESGKLLLRRGSCFHVAETSLHTQYDFEGKRYMYLSINNVPVKFYQEKNHQTFQVKNGIVQNPSVLGNLLYVSGFDYGYIRVLRMGVTYKVHYWIVRVWQNSEGVLNYEVYLDLPTGW